jgi:hypothetical protein
MFGPLFIDGTVTSDVYRGLLDDEFVPFLIGYERIKIGFNKMVPDLTPAMPQFAFCAIFSKRVLPNLYSVILRKDFSWPPNSPDLEPYDCFLWMCLKDRMLKKNSHTIPMLEWSYFYKNATQIYK